jgi:hypothetical protein
MKMTVDQVIDMISVRDTFMTTTRPMLMFLLMPLTLMLGRAALGVGWSDIQRMLIDMFAMHVVHVPIVKVIDMAGMDDSGMPALRAMWMWMVFVPWQVTISHIVPLVGWRDILDIEVTQRDDF